MNCDAIIVINTLRIGGAERFVQQLATYLAHHGRCVGVVVFDYANAALPMPSNIKIWNLARRHSWDVVRVVWRLRKIISEQQPTAILSVMFPVTLLTRIAVAFLPLKTRLIARECRHYSCTIRGMNFPLQRLLFRLGFSRYQTVVCQAHAMREDLARNFHVPASKLAVIPNPVDIERCRALGREPVSHPFFDRHDQPVIVMCAKLCEQKDYPTLLHAMARVCQQQPCRLIALGEGPMKAALLALRDELGLTAAVDFAGVVANPYAYMARADVFVLSSHFEGFPNVVLEAMACGAPVICTDCPSGPNEIITPRETGLLVPPRDPAAMADAMQQLLSDRPRARAMAAAALHDVQQRFALDQIMQRYCALLLGP